MNVHFLKPHTMKIKSTSTKIVLRIALSTALSISTIAMIQWNKNQQLSNFNAVNCDTIPKNTKSLISYNKYIIELNPLGISDTTEKIAMDSLLNTHVITKDVTYSTDKKSRLTGTEIVNVKGLSRDEEFKPSTTSKDAPIERALLADVVMGGKSDRDDRSYKMDKLGKIYEPSKPLAHKLEDRKLAIGETEILTKSVEREKANILTAGVWNDIENWSDFIITKQKTDIKSILSDWKFEMNGRYAVQINNSKCVGAIDAKVELQNELGVTLWTARTDNRGRAELWDFDNQLNSKKKKATLLVNGKRVGSFGETGSGFHTVDLAPNYFGGVIGHQFNEATRAKVDVCFVVDATGSMGDEIKYLQSELAEVIVRSRNAAACSPIRVGSVFYRDNGDEYLTRKFDFTEKLEDAAEFLYAQSAGGGGDFPEAVESGLEEAITKMEWSTDALARIAFLILDAPPHPSAAAKIKEMAAVAAAKGIKIIPIVASGIDVNTEFLMKSIAATTLGDYVYITDHSGVGSSHLKPTGVKENVDLLTNQLVNIISKYTVWSGCDTNITNPNYTPQTQVFGNANTEISAFPNPSTDYLKIKSNRQILKVEFFTMNGQLLAGHNLSGLMQNLANFNDPIVLSIHQISPGIIVVQCTLGEFKTLSSNKSNELSEKTLVEIFKTKIMVSNTAYRSSIVGS